MDGHLADLPTVQVGDLEDFHIECPTIQGLQLEDIFGGFPSETFESALSVLQFWKHQPSDEEVEHPSDQVPEGGFVIVPSRAAPVMRCRYPCPGLGAGIG